MNEKDDRPFFLLLTYNGPYGLGASLNHPARNRFAETYANAFLPSFPRDGVHPWLNANRKFIGNETAIRRVAAETSGVDDGVGEIVTALETLGLTQKTVVVYTADQGWVGGQNGLWGMSDHTRPTAAFDGMMHIPLIVRQPGQIAAGTSDALLSGYDLMPTLLGYIGLAGEEHCNPTSPGLDLSPVVRGEMAEGHEAVFFEMETTRVIRTPSWKYIHRPDGPFELYDLEHDPGERVNLFGQPGHEERVATLRTRLEAFFADHADPRYDLYHGGGSKTHLLTRPQAKRIVPATP
jgi:arylsulfatase A-like enzyme